MNAVQNTGIEGQNETLVKSIGLSGRVTVASTMLGGLLVGGVLVALMTVQGQMSGHGLFMTSSGLFVVGALLGLLHGSVLGFLGRPEGQSTTEAGRAIGRAAMYSVLGAAISWLLTVWVALTSVALYMDRVAPLVLVGLAWVAAAVVGVWGLRVSFRALRNAYARWDDRVLGTALVTATFAALLILFLADRPEIWLVRMRVTEVGAVLLAGFATLWIVGPIVTVGLRTLRSLPGVDRGRSATVGGFATDVGLGLAVGIVAGLLAVPFTPASAVTGATGGIMVALSQVLVTETLLRLFLLSAVAWMILRRYGSAKPEAAVLAVLLVAAAEVLIYLPGVISTGFPTTLAAVSFLAAAIMVPALLFGAVYWKRGFTSALVAHATAAVALLMVV